LAPQACRPFAGGLEAAHLDQTEVRPPRSQSFDRAGTKRRQRYTLKRGNPMNTLHRSTIGALAAAALLSLAGCAGMDTQDKNTAIGAGVGAVGGAVLTGGSAVGTVGGAAVGGIIGHEVSK
jgi:osmotically inducible lipoprotein OsmB